jgi:hypothetical protein
VAIYLLLYRKLIFFWTYLRAHWDVNFQIVSLLRQALPGRCWVVFMLAFCINIWKWVISCLVLGSWFLVLGSAEMIGQRRQVAGFG